MKDAAYFRMLYGYCYWARDRVFAAMEGMPAEEFAAPNGFNYGSIRGILTHALGGEVIWLARWTGAEAASMPRDGDLPTVEALVERWRAEESKMTAFLSGLADADLGREVVTRSRGGEERRFPLWSMLAHVANHTTQHRSEAAEALTMVGRSPGALDLLGYPALLRVPESG